MQLLGLRWRVFAMEISDFSSHAMSVICSFSYTAKDNIALLGHLWYNWADTVNREKYTP